MKIIHNTKTTAGSIVRYNQDKVENGSAVRIGGNVAYIDATKLTAAFEFFANTNAHGGRKNLFIHLKVSCHQQDKLTNRTFRQIAQRCLSEIGLEKNPHVIYRHNDTDNPHIHVVISRVNFSGVLVRDSFIGLKLKRLEDRLDREFELTPSRARLLTEAGVRKPQRNEVLRSLKTGEQSVRNYVQEVTTELLSTKPTLNSFVRNLERRGVLFTLVKTTRGGVDFLGALYSVKPELVNYRFNQTSTHSRTAKSDAFWGGHERKTGMLDNGIPVNFSAVATMPVQLLRPYRFRGGGLGPMFQWNNLKTHLSKIDFDTYKSIIVDRQGKIAKDREALTKSEKWFDKGLALASTIGVDGIVLESLGLGADLARVNDVSKIAKDYVESLARPGASNNVDAGVIGDRSVQKRRFDQVLRGLKGAELSETERSLSTLISEQKWDDFLELTKQCTRQESTRPTEKLALVPDLPHEVRFAVLQIFNEAMLMTTREDERSREERISREHTELLLSLFKRMRLKDAGLMILEHRGDVTKVPVEQIRLLKDPVVRMEVVRLMGGQSPFAAIDPDAERQKDRKPETVSDGPSKRKRKGKE